MSRSTIGSRLADITELTQDWCRVRDGRTPSFGYSLFLSVARFSWFTHIP
jgi:hypothetical protein